ncbi:MAG: VOC family protein, partial [Saezia sp.]
EMAIFSYEEGYPGGALVSSKCYDDHKNGPGTTILYLNVNSIAATLEKVKQHQGQITFPCTSIGENGFIAGFEDLDGNAIGIWSMTA